MMKFMNRIQRHGYLRAAGELYRQGYPQLAAKLKKQADNLE